MLGSVAWCFCTTLLTYVGVVGLYYTPQAHTHTHTHTRVNARAQACEWHSRL